VTAVRLNLIMSQRPQACLPPFLLGHSKAGGRRGARFEREAGRANEPTDRRRLRCTLSSGHLRPPLVPLCIGWAAEPCRLQGAAHMTVPWDSVANEPFQTSACRFLERIPPRTSRLRKRARLPSSNIAPMGRDRSKVYPHRSHYSCRSVDCAGCGS